jgi:hypothetical protein
MFLFGRAVLVRTVTFLFVMIMDIISKYDQCNVQQDDIYFIFMKKITNTIYSDKYTDQR